MGHSGIKRAVDMVVLALSTLCLLNHGVALGGTTGKLTGRVLDKNGKPVVGATVILVGQRLGAISDTEGYYNVLNIPPGSYDVNVSHVAYKQLVVQNVEISSDKTTRQDAQVQETTVAVEEIVIKADRPVVDVSLTSTRATVTSKEIQELPVQDLQDVVNLQAGVVDGHVRGGRLGEVQYQVDGVSVNNPYDNSSGLRVDRSLLQEVQVISGVFDAEYGQAMSGVVNAVLKDGTDSYQWDAEFFAGGFFFPGNSRRLVDDKVQPGDIQNYQMNVSGPTTFPETVFLLSARHYRFSDYVLGTRVFLPTDSSDFQGRVFRGTGDRKEMSLGYSREWSGVVKITNTSIPGTKISYQALPNWIDGRRSEYGFHLNPDGLSKQRTISISHGIDWAHTLSDETYYNVSLRQSYFDYTDFAYKDVMDRHYDDAGPPIGDPNYELGAYVQGVSFTRFQQTTNTLLAKASVVSQVRRDHQLKMGGEIQFPEIKFGAPGYLTYATVEGVQSLVRFKTKPPSYNPIIGAAFAQDQLEWEDLTVRGGLRVEYFDARATVPSDPANPANSIPDVPQSHPASTTAKVAVAPRLGVAFPITDRAGIHFAYGRFYQFPAIGDIFSNSDYSVLADLQAGTVGFGVMGNPNVKPERTVQYEIGYKYAISDRLGIDMSVFYKDIRDLLGVEFISTYNDAEYARMTNVDFGDVVGFTVALDQRDFGIFSTSIDYTWQLAQGNSSDPRETATRAQAGEDPRPRFIPLNWDQRHTFNATVLFSRSDLSGSAVLRVASGQPYTPALESGFGYGLDANSGRKPFSVGLDLRAERPLALWGLNTSVFGRVFNVFDTRYFNGFVFSSTGSPFYSRFPETDRYQLADPTRFYPPRKIELGIKMNYGS